MAGIRDKALSYSEASLCRAQEDGDREQGGMTHVNLGLLHFLDGSVAEARDHLDAALAVARDIGHAHMECLALWNLGMVHESVNDLGLAQVHLERALTIARENGYMRSERQILGYVGRVHAQRAEFDEARRCLDEAEGLVHATTDWESLAILLAIRAETEQVAGCANVAKDALAAAELIANDHSVTLELGHALARARSSLA